MSIIIFTDGSYKRKSGHCGCGVHFPNKEYSDITHKIVNGLLTNQRAELYAIYLAIKSISITDKRKIIIYSDSMYAINCLSKWIHTWIKNNWIGTNKKQVLNKDIIEETYSLVMQRDIQFIHVLAHTRKTDFLSLGNQRADILATTAGSTGTIS